MAGGGGRVVYNVSENEGWIFQADGSNKSCDGKRYVHISRMSSVGRLSREH